MQKSNKIFICLNIWIRYFLVIQLYVFYSNFYFFYFQDIQQQYCNVSQYPIFMKRQLTVLFKKIYLVIQLKSMFLVSIQSKIKSIKKFQYSKFFKLSILSRNQNVFQKCLLKITKALRQHLRVLFAQNIKISNKRQIVKNRKCNNTYGCYLHKLRLFIISILCMQNYMCMYIHIYQQIDLCGSISFLYVLIKIVQKQTLTNKHD
eukprot:TRINITY_DN632_c0_g1_i8.p4 TRINITY_DN632_c0_g1~~TRINITY_DN632_c0_g1_i8.p4  ORF type:complete len:204 (+),score=-18.62 TRINITY_DN632_c0_g1_i8:1250-1861(+)